MSGQKVSIIKRTNEEEIYTVAGPWDDVVSYSLIHDGAVLTFTDEAVLTVSGVIGFVKHDDE